MCGYTKRIKQILGVCKIKKKIYFINFSPTSFHRAAVKKKACDAYV